MKQTFQKILKTAGVVAMACMVPVAYAADTTSYPDRAIRLVVPFTPGAATDTVARLIAKSMSEYLKQTIVVENKGGAGATIGAAYVANAAPDGYTLLATTQGVHIFNPAIYPTLGYDPVKSFAMVGQLVSASLVFSVKTDSKFKTMKEVIAYAKKHPGELSYASAGQGSSLNAAGEMLKYYADVDILHVPYRGGGPAMQDFLAGRTTMNSSYVSSIKPHVDAGLARILAIGSKTRSKFVPDVPTMVELGYPDFNSDTWTGIAAPAGTPKEIVQKLNAAIAFALKENGPKLENDGFAVLGGTPQEMEEQVKEELVTVTPLLKKLLSTTKN
ncbi:MAG TPA: tripartite tricarboxylate transporter substrate binding protein [Eoetvoesiella sp.]